MDLGESIAFYEGTLATYSDPGPQAGWLAGTGYQLANFVALCEVDGLVDGVSVLDVGCGVGGLVDYFAQIGLRVDYTGVDVSQKIIDAARARHPDHVFEVRNILTSPPDRRFDFVLCSGAMNYRIPPDHHRWMGEMISRMYGLAEQAAVFNVANAAFRATSKGVQLQDAGQFVPVWPEEMIHACRQLTPDVHAKNLWSSTFEIVLRRPARIDLPAFAQRIGGIANPSTLDAVIEYAMRRRRFAELRDYLLELERSPTVLAYLGLAHARLGEHAAAIAALEQACGAAPDRAGPCTNLANLHVLSKQLDLAERWFREALARDPAAFEARWSLVTLLVNAGRRDEARTLALAASPGPLRDLLDGATALQPADALAAYERALAAAPKLVDALVAVASGYEQVGRWTEAVKLWERALGVVGEEPRLRARLVRARSLSG